MDKFGVDTQTEEGKQASEKTKPTCPECGADLASAALTNVPICPRCGSRPFERKA